MPSVLITGASKGIGRACATEFASRGYDVIATARNPDSLEGLDVAARLQLDVTDDASVAAAIAAAGPVDVLVSNAGTIFHSAVEAIPLDRFSETFGLNTVGALRITQAVLPAMRRQGHGRLLYVSSILGRIVVPGSAAYAATKWALEALVEELATEVASFGITATLLEPSAVASGALDDVERFTLQNDPYPGLLSDEPRSPQSMLTVEEVAQAVADAAEGANTPLRIPVGRYAIGLLSTDVARPSSS